MSANEESSNRDEPDTPAPDPADKRSGRAPAAADDGDDSEPTADNGTPEDSDRPPDPLEQARADTARIRDQLLRTAADYDNFRKRTRRELDDAQKRGREELLRELLPVFDNLERAVVHAGQASDAKAVADGVGMVLKQFGDTLARIGIKRVPTVGVSFDPTVHEAIQQLETDEHPPGTIVAEVQPGYIAGEKLLRAAMVVVAKPSQKNGEGDKTEAN
jgi:molecular chaperone GrpE